jgi:hypothetical protein
MSSVKFEQNNPAAMIQLTAASPFDDRSADRPPPPRADEIQEGEP